MGGSITNVYWRMHRTHLLHAHYGQEGRLRGHPRAMEHSTTKLFDLYMLLAEWYIHVLLNYVDRFMYCQVFCYEFAAVRQPEHNSEIFVAALSPSSSSSALSSPLFSPFVTAKAGFFLKGLLKGFCLLPDADKALAASGLDPVIKDSSNLHTHH